MKFWYHKSWQAIILWPLSMLFGLIIVIRRIFYRLGLFSSYRANVPVVIVGNLSVGGNGKTPMVIWLTQQLQECGLNVGIISRGYGSQSKTFPLLVTITSDPVLTGDEPLLMAKRTGAPVCISPNRQKAIELLQKNFSIDVIIADDGLQHYKLQRDIEIVVMDAERGFGNSFLLPAGPLREPQVRLKSVDFLLINGKSNHLSQYIMRLIPKVAINLLTGEQRYLNEFERVNAIAGIGNPQRFFSMLQGLNIQLEKQQSFSDHQAFTPHLLAAFPQNIPLFMTEKDAVKCQTFAQAHFWYVPVEAELSGGIETALLEKINELVKQKYTLSY